MPSAEPLEHFVTLFDHNFLPMAMCLHESLLRHAQPFRLWVLCVDELVEQQLRVLALPYVSLIPRREVETEALLAVRPGRTVAEYCWTLTPFCPQAVFEREPQAARVTYVDADVFFFHDPRRLLAELDASRKHVLITEHAYDPQYDHTHTYGRFCVQFLTFRRTPEGAHVMKWWQDRCLEWCFRRQERGLFGDQKYLDCWPELFASEVHILQQVKETLAPWNERYFEDKRQPWRDPVMYHFHDLRLISPSRVRLYSEYEVGAKGLHLYQAYLASLARNLQLLNSSGFATPTTPYKGVLGHLKLLKKKLKRCIRFADLPPVQA